MKEEVLSGFCSLSQFSAGLLPEAGSSVLELCARDQDVPFSSSHYFPVNRVCVVFPGTPLLGCTVLGPKETGMNEEWPLLPWEDRIIRSNSIALCCVPSNGEMEGTWRSGVAQD